MAIALVNTSEVSNYSGSSATNLAVTAASLTAGNFIVVVCRTYTSEKTVTSVTDTAGNTYFKAIGRAGTFNGTRIEIWYAYNVIGNGSNVVTVNMSAGVQYYGVVTAQYSGIKTTADPLDQTATGDTSSNTSITSSAFSTTQADELIIVACDYDAATGQTWTAGANLTIQKQDNSNVKVLADRIVSSLLSSETVSMSLSTSRNLGMNVATFKGGVPYTGNPPYPNNFQFIKVGNGMSAGERIR